MANAVYYNSLDEIWHSKHKLPENPTLDQRVKWHMEHARKCSCPSFDEDILEELKRRYLGEHQDFWIFYNVKDHKALGLWAAVCAEKFLQYFEEKYPEDNRPQQAIKTLREWIETGKFSMSVIRNASLAAHAAAKEAKKEDEIAIYTAHAAGQAVATAHVPTHAFGVVFYSIKISAALNPADVKKAVNKELEWQIKRIPENLKPWAESWREKTKLLINKNIRMQLDQER